MLFLTCESEVELLWSKVFVLKSSKQRLHLDYEQVGAVLPSFGHCTDILQQIKVCALSLTSTRLRNEFF